MTTVLETLEKAYELHEASPWIQRAYERDCDGVMGFCAAGAVLHTNVDGVWKDLSGAEWPRRGLLFHEALTILNKIVKGLMPDYPYVDVVEYNDSFAKEKADITKVFELAIQEARLRELATF